MRAAAKRMWEARREGFLRSALAVRKTASEEWVRVVKKGAYFGYGEGHLNDALMFFWLAEDSIAEAELDFALQCLEAAEATDDCGGHGKMGESVSETVMIDQPATVYSFGPVEDKRQAWHDEDLGRGFRARALFTCRWLKHGIREEALLRLAVDRTKAWFDFQLGLPKESPEAQRVWDTPRHNLPIFLQLCAEVGDFELLQSYYRRVSHRKLVIPPTNLRFTRSVAEVLYLLALHRTGEVNLEELLPTAMEKCYSFVCREVGREMGAYYLGEDALGLAYLRAQMLGLSTEPRELLRRIKEDS